jgi:hypothetical protein
LGVVKLGVLCVSGVASVGALVLGQAVLKPVTLSVAATSADEAESSTVQ